MKQLFLLALIFVTFQGFGQRLDGERVTYSYKQYPTEPIPERYDTYQIYFVNHVPVPSNVEIKGLKQVENELPEKDFFKIELSVMPFTTKKYETKSVSKKVNGGRKTYYYAQEDFYKKVNYKIYGFVENPTGDVEDKYKKYQSGTITKTVRIKSKKYPNKQTAQKQLRKIKTRKKRSFKKDLYNEYLSKQLTKKLTFTEEMKMLRFFKIKKFKRFDYSDFDEAQEIVLNASKLLVEDKTALDAFKKEVKPAIALWKKALTESNLEKRKTRVNEKVTLIAYLNLARVHFMMQEYEKAIEFAEKLTAIDKSFKGIRLLKELAEKNAEIKNNYLATTSKPDYKKL
ncbi:MAG TPA: tetratricopeptide repeat protein [Salinivirga sp.]|uniref:tetratricopeptide repeat protein n=1 Tax=Salinivirga sp. TaxID=1970192 RepID=UPI002B48C745|nr:tetratricopeptide repeat protein [Salinivirga sp.]HKK60819.1 tetratricopeptide repeat protein [Salinivirga sp.]